MDIEVEDLSLERIRGRRVLALLIPALRGVRFRGKYRLLNLFAPSHGSRSARIFGYRMTLDLADWIQRNMYLGSFEQQQTAKLLSYLRPGMVFVDVGANVGYYTALASSLIQNGRAIAFEPQPYAFNRLSAWIKANGCGNVLPICAALGREPGQISVYFEDAVSSNHTASLLAASRGLQQLGPEDSDKSKTVVDVRTLDSEVERLGIQHIDAMKIDVDGQESDVLAGCTRLLENRRIHAVLCEFSKPWLEQAGSSVDELEKFLQARGFVRRAIYGDDSLSDRWFVLVAPHG